MADTVMDKTENRFTEGVIYKMIIAMTFLLAFGLVMIFSASSYDTADQNFKKHVVFIAIGVAAMVIMTFVPYSTYRGKMSMIVTYILSAGCTTLLFSPLKVKENGATRWINLFGLFNIQIADIVRFLMILFIASYISMYWREMNTYKRVIGLWVLVGVQAVYLLFVSTNLSSCIVLALICFLSTFITSDKWQLHAIIAGMMVIIAVVIVAVLMNTRPTQDEIIANGQDNYRFGRIYGWLAKDEYDITAGYQILQSLYAIGSGSLLGKGLGNGTQKISAIPEAQNDMIFAIVCEELGLIGVIMLFALYGYLIYQMFVIVRESTNVMGSVLVIGVMIHLICQIIINVSVATNVFPNTGVALPFISSGGSALIMTMAECGLCIGVRRQQMRRTYQKKLNE